MRIRLPVWDRVRLTRPGHDVNCPLKETHSHLKGNETMSMPEPRIAIKGNTPIPSWGYKPVNIVDSGSYGFNAEQAIGILVAESSVCNEWGEAALWQHVCRIVRQGRNGQLWTKAELNRMMVEAEDE